LEPSGYAIWKGVALTGKYQFNGKSTFALRGEVYDDHSGFTTGIIQTLKEITLTYEYKFSSMFLTRLEFRRDWSTVPSFEDENGITTKDNQTHYSSVRLFPFKFLIDRRKNYDKVKELLIRNYFICGYINRGYAG